MDDVRFIEGLAVYEDLLIHKLQMVARQTDDTLHEMRMILVGIFENDDVAALEVAVRKKFFVPMPAAAEDEFVDEEMITDKQGALHRRGRNLEGLDDETCTEEGENYGHQERFEIF